MCEISSGSRTKWRLRWIGHGVIDLITTVSHITQNGVRLLYQIDLEPDMVDDIGTFPRDGDNSDQVDEWYTSLAIIDQRCLAFFAGVEHTFEMSDSDIVGVLSLGSFDDLAIGS